MKFVYVQPQEIRNVWVYVRGGLCDLLKKTQEPWIPEDVYASLVNGKAGLWLANKDNYTVGFIVGVTVNNAFHVWCASGSLQGEIEVWFEKVEEIARASNAERITFDSWRPAWSKVAPKLGFKPRSWAKEIDYGR